jgi:hypothetical protein
MTVLLIAKATTQTGTVLWLRAARSGRYLLGDRKQASTFETYEEARDAIRTVPPRFADNGLRFSVEAVS